MASKADESGKGRIGRREALKLLTVAGTTIALPKFLTPTEAAAAGDTAVTEAQQLFLGQDKLPVPPPNARRYTTACQYCNVGCGYVVYVWPVNETPGSGTGALYSEEPAPPLGDWVSPTFVTRRTVDGVDSYIAVLPDKDCVVNRGDHSPRGGSNALTVYTDYPHPLTKPTERLLRPQVRPSKGGSLSTTSWDQALDRVAQRIEQTLRSKGPAAIGLWGADHLSPELNYVQGKFLFAPRPKGLYDPTLGPDAGVGVRAIHNRAKFNSEYPSLEDHFGSNNALLYSYADFEAANTVLFAGTNSYETGTVLYNRIHAAGNKKVVIDPRRTVPAANAEDGGGVHLQLRPGTDVILLNSLMQVIVSQNLHDQAFIAGRTNPETFQALQQLVMQDRWTPESTEAVTSVPPEKVRAAAKLLGRPNKTSILFEKGVIWQGTQNEAVIGSYANLALLLGSIGGEGRVFGRQGGHQDAIIGSGVEHPEADASKHRNLWQELEKGTIDTLIVLISNPVRMSEQTQQLREYVKRVPFVVELNIRPSDMTELADVVLPTAAWSEYDYTRQNLERRVRLNQRFVDPPGEARPDYLALAAIGRRLAERNVLDPKEWNFASQEQVWDELRQTEEAKSNGLHLLSRDMLAGLGTTGVQLPVTRLQRVGLDQGLKGVTPVGTERLYTDSFKTPNGKANFVPRDQTWTAADPLAFLPEEIKPNTQYPFFVTTVRYQHVWQSGYTYRWTTDLARQLPYPEITINPNDASRNSVKAGDWLELTNQYGTSQGVANVSDVVPPGVLSMIFAWHGPTDKSETGEPMLYANNLVAGGTLQQASNAAYFKNTRAALRRLDRTPITGQSAPSMSLQARTVRGMGQGGSAGVSDSVWNVSASGKKPS